MREMRDGRCDYRKELDIRDDGCCERVEKRGEGRDKTMRGVRVQRAENDVRIKLKGKGRKFKMDNRHIAISPTLIDFTHSQHKKPQRASKLLASFNKFRIFHHPLVAGGGGPFNTCPILIPTKKTNLLGVATDP